MKQYEQKIDALGELYLVKKAPFQLPANVKEMFVKYGPYVAAVLLVLSIPGLLAAFGIGVVASPFSYLSGVKFGLTYNISLITGAISIILSFMSLPGLFKRQLSGWRLSWYASLVSQIGSLVSFQLLSVIIGLLISMYFLYQLKSYYK